MKDGHRHFSQDGDAKLQQVNKKFYSTYNEIESSQNEAILCT